MDAETLARLMGQMVPVVPQEGCAVLVVVSGANAYQWRSQKGNFFAERTNDVLGVPVEWITSDLRATALDVEIRRRRPRMVVIHAFLFTAEVLSSIARRYPGTLFVVINHSSLAYSYLSGNHHFEHIQASREGAFIYALTDDRIPLEHERMIWLANPVREHPLFSTPSPSREGAARIHICGRGDTIKGHFVAATALPLLARTRDITAVLNIRGNTGHGIDEYLTRHGITIEATDWIDWEDFPQFIRDRVDLLLHPTLTESHNLVGIEHLLCGVPVVGTSALRYLPPDWRVDAEDPWAQAEKANELLGDWEEAQSVARAFGEAEAVRCNRAFDATLCDLAERAGIKIGRRNESA